MEIKVAIESIEEKLISLTKVRDTRDFNVWRKGTIHTLLNIYSEDDDRIKTFRRLKSINGFSDYSSETKDEAKDLLNGIINDIRRFGIVKSSSESKIGGVNVNVNQSNTQSQSTSVNIDLKLILDVIKEELRGSEIEELKDILESKEEPKEKKKKFVDKIKSFGADVSSNILANLLTNPMVFEQLRKMF